MTDSLPLVPQGAAFFPVETPGETRKYAFLLVPGFTLLAFSSAVEPLRIANQLSQQPLYQWRLLSEGGAAVASSSGISVCTDGPLAALPRDTRLFVCSGNPAAAAAAEPVVALVRAHARFGGTVGGICTGAVALAKAGLLDRASFTLHWENQPAFCEDFPELTPTPAMFEIAAKVMTCGGGAASTDMMISLIAQDHGAEFAAMVSEMCLRKVMVGVDAAQRSALSVLIRSRNPGLIAMVARMKAHLEDPVPLAEIVTASGYSRRHVERMFLSVLGETPGDFYRGLRLDHARNLLSTTEMTLIEVAVACGFSTVAHFSRSFRARFGVAPTKFNRTLSAPAPQPR
ncbi:AraC family transcriptional regulator with amidase-like domain [Rhodobacter viridis]|uniref:AraC family transcriptional regulator with amidase-like domain n=1 Tax=Rhodobacter viridis TaxID=1054202 RepID=A0A318TW65_9RHOB|nr:GlxA family transcriptional regulator [Rhodobacter viridis]PYF08633.1 AraC family transcriptional regulator with amidase-like domain [Rhodobacter viridis]